MPKRMVKVNCLAIGTATPPVLKNSDPARFNLSLHKARTN